MKVRADSFFGSENLSQRSAYRIDAASVVVGEADSAKWNSTTAPCYVCLMRIASFRQILLQ
jgi:hypothetical protein